MMGEDLNSMRHIFHLIRRVTKYHFYKQLFIVVFIVAGCTNTTEVTPWWHTELQKADNVIATNSEEAFVESLYFVIDRRQIKLRPNINSIHYIVKGSELLVASPNESITDPSSPFQLTSLGFLQTNEIEPREVYQRRSELIRQVTLTPEEVLNKSLPFIESQIGEPAKFINITLKADRQAEHMYRVPVIWQIDTFVKNGETQISIRVVINAQSGEQILATSL
jgi:hypothetical protein